MEIAVFCGSNRGNNPAFIKATAMLGKSFANNGIEVVYGGGKINQGENATTTLLRKIKE
ncbi:MAG: hypothetical protein V5789_06630 [Colwellia sp.]